MLLSVLCLFVIKYLICESRYQKKCDELSVLNNEVEEKYNQLVQDRKDIVDFLKKTLEERQEEISNLQDRLVGEQQVNLLL